MAGTISTASHARKPPALGRRDAKPERGRRGLGNTATAVILVLPGLTLFLAVAVYPLLASIETSFFNQSLIRDGRTFAGLANYRLALSDAFWPQLRATVVFSVAGTVLPVSLGVALAFLLNARLRGRTILRGVLLVPWVLPGVVVAFLWAWIFNQNYGVLNYVLGSLGVTDGQTRWLGSANGAMAAIVIAKTWQSFPWIMVVALAALQTLPSERLEAAAVDGATRFQRFRFVSMPHLLAPVGLITLLEFIYNFGNFDLAFVMTGGGPGTATTTLAVGVYQKAFKDFDLGSAAALGVLWLVILTAVSSIYVWINARVEDDQ